MLVFTDNLKWLIIWSLVIGGALCLVYDVIRALRLFFGVSPRLETMRGDKLFIFKAVYLFVSDFAFCIFSAVCLLLLAYYTNGGHLRGLSLLCAALGFAVIRCSISKVFSCVLFKAVSALKWLLSKMVKPLFLLYRLTLGKIICIIKDGIRKKRERRKAQEEALLHISGRKENVTVEKALAQNNRKERIVIGRRAPKL